MISSFDALVGPTYTLISPKAEGQRSINAYLQRIESDKSSGRFLLLRSPGQVPIFQPTGGVGQFRGTGIELNNQIVCCIDNKVLQLDSKTHVLVTYPQTIANDLMPVRFAASGVSIMVVSAGQLWRGDGVNLVQKTISGVTFIDVVYIQSYYVAIGSAASGNGSTFYYSTDDGVTFTAGQSQTTQAAANNFIGAIVHQDIMFIYGNRVTFAYSVGSNPNAPFVSQSAGGTIPFGAETGPSIQSIGNYRFWLSRQKEGQYIVYRGQGYQTQRISNFAVENAIRTYAKNFGVSDAFGQVYKINGQEFYRLTFTAANATWELNSTLTETEGFPQWSEIQYQPLGGSGGRHRANLMVSAFGTIITGDFQNGWLYEFTPDNYTDFGFPIPFTRRAPHIVTGGLKARYDRIQLICETGIGIDPPLWLHSYNMTRPTFVTTLANEVANTNITAAQSVVLQNIYDQLPYTPLSPFPSPDEMFTTLGFVPWGGPQVLANGTVIGTQPQIGLKYSNNGGKSFSPIIYRNLGMPGDDPNVYWDQMGTANDRVFELNGDFPGRLSIVTAFLDSDTLLS